jgi:hypothetical protein
MKSRIHLAIEYSPPELKMRRMIWTHYLEAIPATERAIDFDEAINKLVRDEVNGREIANAVNTAKTLARFQGKPLELHHIETVLGIRREFDASLAKKLRAIEATESRQGSIAMLNRKNSILVSSEESKWFP